MIKKSHVTTRTNEELKHKVKEIKQYSNKKTLSSFEKYKKITPKLFQSFHHYPFQQYFVIVE